MGLYFVLSVGSGPIPCRPIAASCTVRKVLGDFAVCDVLSYCKALCDVQFRQIEGNGRTFRHILLSNGVISLIFCQCGTSLMLVDF